MSKADEILERPIENTGIDAGQLATVAGQEDVIQMFLHAANFKEDESLRIPITIKRGGVPLIPTFHIRPLSEDEFHKAHVKATRFIANPAGRRLPKIEDSTDESMKNSWGIYLATVEEDREKLWDNPKIQKAIQAQHPELVLSRQDAGAQIINLTLTAGEKAAVISKILDVSYPDDVIDGGDDGELSDIDYAKN